MSPVPGITKRRTTSGEVVAAFVAGYHRVELNVRAVRRSVSGCVVVISLVIAFTGAAPASAAPLSYASVPVGGWAINGTGRAVVEAGGTVFVGGAFTAAVSPTGATTARANVAAFDPATGALRTDFVANTNGTVRALASDGTSLFLAGSFTSVNGVARARLAAVDLSTGAVRTGFRADASATVTNLDVYGSQLYVTGQFTSIAGAVRNRVAAVDTSTGAIDTGFDPNADNVASAIVVSPDGSRVYVGGRFTNIGGGARSFLAAVSRSTGALVGPAFASLAYEVLDVDVAPDGGRVFGAVAGYGNQAASWNTSSGVRQWRYTVDGDVQAIRYANGNVYFGFHEGALGDHTVRLLAADSATGALVNFRPVIDSFNGVWDIDATATDLVIGGEFLHVAGVARHGIANFRASTSSSQVFVAPGSTWRYLDNGSNQGTGWSGTSFDDSAWRSGPSQLGYGDGGEATVVSYGPNASNRYVTTYFRASFSVADTSTVASLQLQLLRDDGAVVYINGTEVLRSNMTTGTIAYTTLAATTISGSAETAFTSYSLSPTVLRSGTNVIAVEIHQTYVSSSDISFDLGLTS